MADMYFDERLGRSKEAIYLLPLEEKAKKLKEIYKKKLGEDLNLESPVLFTEKIQWYKLFYNDEKAVKCIDKVTFKDYVRERIGEGHSAKLLRVWESPEEISFNELPKQFVVKSNCQENGRYIRIIKDRDSYDLDSLKEEISKYWFNPLNLLINGFCACYQQVKPKVFVEEYLSLSGEQMIDYKFFCFSGEPEFCYVSREEFVENQEGFGAALLSFYDLEWNEMNISYGINKPFDGISKPKHYKEMQEAAREIAKGFPFARVDFFDTDEQFYVGEITFYPGGGLKKYEPDEFNKYMGDLFVIPKE